MFFITIHDADGQPVAMHDAEEIRNICKTFNENFIRITYHNGEKHNHAFPSERRALEEMSNINRQLKYYGATR